MNPPRILIVAGGTGGHLYPGIAVAQALWRAPLSEGQRRPEIRFVVRRGDLGREILQREGFDVREIAGQGLPRRLSPTLFKFPAAFLNSCRETFALLDEEKPDFVLGMGGYLSFPVLLAATWKRIPTLIHEQNAFPGLANRLLGRWVHSIAVSFPGSDSFFPKRKTWLSGLPVRLTLKAIEPALARETLGLKKNCLTFLAFGGSLGAHRLNEILLDVWQRLVAAGKPFQVLHISGPRDFAVFETAFKEAKIPGKLLSYCHDMPSAYAAADIVIARSGASTIAELTTIGRPAILIPYPYATNDHQWFNAQVLVQKGCAEAIREKDLRADVLAQRLQHFIDDAPALLSWQARCYNAEFTTPKINPAVILAKHILEKAGV